MLSFPLKRAKALILFILKEFLAILIFSEHYLEYFDSVFFDIFINFYYIFYCLLFSFITSFIVLTALSNFDWNRWEYVFSVSSILVCPKYLTTIIIFAPLLISNEAHECLKSCVLITLVPALFAYSTLCFLSASVWTGFGPPYTKDFFHWIP